MSGAGAAGAAQQAAPARQLNSGGDWWGHIQPLQHLGRLRPAAAERDTLGPSPSLRVVRHPGGSDKALERLCTSDRWLVAFVLTVATSAFCKHLDIMTPRACLEHVLLLALALTIVLLPLRDAAAYRRWRAPLAAGLRLLMAQAAVCHITAGVVAEGLGTQAGEYSGVAAGGLLRPLRFLAALLWTSHAPRLAVLGLGMPLPPAQQAAAQLAMVAACWAPGDGVCAVVVRDPPAARLVAGWHGVFSVLAAPLSPAWLSVRSSPRGGQSPLQQCDALRLYFRLSLGFLLPVLLQLRWASSAYCRRRAEQWAAANAAAAAAGGSGNGSRGRPPPPPLPRGWEGQLVHSGAMWLGQESKQGEPDPGLCILRLYWGLLVLAFMWEASNDVLRVWPST